MRLEPSSDARQFARLVRDHYTAFLDEGFSVEQATALLLLVVDSSWSRDY